MAVATISMSVFPHPLGKDETQRCEVLRGVATLLAGGTYVTGGIPLPWTFVNNAGYAEMKLSGNVNPVDAFFFSNAGSNLSYGWNRVANTLTIMAGGNMLANNAAIPADVIGFTAEFLRGY